MHLSMIGGRYMPYAAAIASLPSPLPTTPVEGMVGQVPGQGKEALSAVRWRLWLSACGVPGLTRPFSLVTGLNEHASTGVPEREHPVFMKVPPQPQDLRGWCSMG